jgi:hypothetical protein
LPNLGFFSAAQTTDILAMSPEDDGRHDGNHDTRAAREKDNGGN